MSIKTALANSILQLLFLPKPVLEMSPKKKQDFDGLITEMMVKPGGQEIDYALPYPKYEFLMYLVECQDVLFHGSNNLEISELTPNIQTDWNGKQIEAVFATRDCLSFLPP